MKRLLRKLGYLPYHRRTFGLSVTNGFFESLTSFSESLNKISSFAQQGEDLLVERLMRQRLGFDPRTTTGFYVDVGAYHPMSHSTTYLLYRYGWSGICCDISERSCSLIRKFRPRDVVYHCAIATTDESGTFLSTSNVGLGNKAQRQSINESEDIARIDGRCLNSLLQESGRTQTIDYLNIDIEGAEMAALQGLDFDRWAPKLISVEIHETSVDSGLKHPIANFLTEKGYECLACAAITYIFARRKDLVSLNH